MCGIAGILDFNNPNITSDLISDMLLQIQYRGPDESGIYINNNVGLGNVRLSIIDLTSGQQPLTNSDNTLWIVYNGEIFNYIELKEELKKKGYKFRTNSDTEVLLLLYQEYREKCLEKLNGQFAFAIWDNIKEELFVARDRVGIRPLFYSTIKNTFLFGSEIKTILQHPSVIPEIDNQSLMQVLTFWATITPRTIFKNIYELSPGSYLKINRAGKEIKKYWSLEFPEENKYDGNLNDAMEQLNELFIDSVNLRLRSDVPVAAYLSGGIDSSTTTYYIKKVSPDILNTFSIGFKEKEFDETVYQNEVSEYLDTNHTGFKCSNNDIARYFPEVIWHSEIPIIRTAPVPMHCLSKKVRENNIKVVITGEGADEMLAGYNIFKEVIIRQFWSRFPDSKYRPLLLQKLYPYISQFRGKNKNMLKFFFGYKLTETNSPFYSHLLRWNNTSKIQAYLSDEIHEDYKNYNPVEEIHNILVKRFNNWDLLSKAQWLETSIFMSGYLLSSQGDRMAMANSVEGRYPFLDHRIIEFCSELPGNYKLNGLNEKYILKKMMSGKLPESVLTRSKQAYRAPIINSFFSKNSPEYVKEMLSESTIKRTGLFKYNEINRLIKKINSGGTITELDNMSIAAIISTQLLHEIFINKSITFVSNKKLNNLRIINKSKNT